MSPSTRRRRHALHALASLGAAGRRAAPVGADGRRLFKVVVGCSNMLQSNGESRGGGGIGGARRARRRRRPWRRRTRRGCSRCRGSACVPSSVRACGRPLAPSSLASPNARPGFANAALEREAWGCAARPPPRRQRCGCARLARRRLLAVCARGPNARDRTPRHGRRWLHRDARLAARGLADACVADRRAAGRRWPRRPPAPASLPTAGPMRAWPAAARRDDAVATAYRPLRRPPRRPRLADARVRMAAAHGPPPAASAALPRRSRLD